ncbi:uncharacterized protein LOC8261841 [Ricinus communis]|uniref:uncharacterized protein LOC8261841 n=1 Tax=Ricinus communis TaxID=3988 RepID=UPI00201AB302|nr:uncharacterized protein LOC8261841 [Ricinus communis]
MAQASANTTTKRYAVVTGANRGIGFEVCRQLASNGIVVVLTARDENRGLEAVKKLKDSGVSDDLVVFHQLDVADPDSISSLADFIKIQFGRLDILVNNAGIGGIVYHPDNFRRGFEHCGGWPDGKQVSWTEMATQSFDLAGKCVKTNYYGAKGMVEALAPLLQSSDSAMIVNVSSLLGLLQNIPGEWAKAVLSDIENLTEERVDEVVNQFLKDFKDGFLEAKGWPMQLSGYIVAKAALNAYTRILAKKYPSLRVNALCPGFCRTDMTINIGLLTAPEGAENVVRLALLPKDGPSGCFFNMKEIHCFSVAGYSSKGIGRTEESYIHNQTLGNETNSLAMHLRIFVLSCIVFHVPFSTKNCEKLVHLSPWRGSLLTAAVASNLKTGLTVLVLISQLSSSMAEPTKRYAVVTGANRGLGWGIVKLLASKGIMVILTARDEKRGLQAVEKLKESHISANVVFHQLDVMDPASISSLAEFIKIQYGKLDILVNNAGIGGTITDSSKLAASTISNTKEDLQNVWSKVLIQNYDLAEECLSTNYYGAKRTTEVLIPLLQLSDSPRIVNVSSTMGMLKYIPNQWAKGLLSDCDSFSEETVDEVLIAFLKDFKEDSLGAKGWPTFLSAYTISKAAMNAHTRILAKKYPNFCINCVCPGSVKTDINNNTGHFSIEEAAIYPVKLALLPKDGPSGLFFLLDQLYNF